jgi:site-specific DNA recombinase
VPASLPPHDRRPIRAETRATLVAAIARGRSTLVTVPAIISSSQRWRGKCSTRQVNMTISLAFLAPELVKAAIEGRLPRGTKAGRARIAEANDGVWKAFRSRHARLSGSE